jgi:hypothetical protein
MTNLLFSEPNSFFMMGLGLGLLFWGCLLKRFLLPPAALRPTHMTYTNNPDFMFKSAGQGQMLMLALTPEAKLFIQENYTFDATTEKPMAYRRAILFIEQIRYAGLTYAVSRLPYFSGGLH